MNTKSKDASTPSSATSWPRWLDLMQYADARSHQGGVDQHVVHRHRVGGAPQGKRRSAVRPNQRMKTHRSEVFVEAVRHGAQDARALARVPFPGGNQKDAHPHPLMKSKRLTSTIPRCSLWLARSLTIDSTAPRRRHAPSLLHCPCRHLTRWAGRERNASVRRRRQIVFYGQPIPAVRELVRETVGERLDQV